MLHAHSLLLFSHSHTNTFIHHAVDQVYPNLTLVDRLCVVYHGLTGGEMFVSDCGIQKGVLWPFPGLL